MFLVLRDRTCSLTVVDREIMTVVDRENMRWVAKSQIVKLKIPCSVSQATFPLGASWVSSVRHNWRKQ